MKKQFILLAVAGLVLTSCGIYTKYQRPEDITTDGLYEHDLDGQSLDSLSLFAASDTVSIASLSCSSFLRTRNYSRSSSKSCKATPTCFPPSNASGSRSHADVGQTFVPVFVYAHSAVWRQQFRQFQRFVGLFRYCLGKLESRYLG